MAISWHLQLYLYWLRITLGTVIGATNSAVIQIETMNVGASFCFLTAVFLIVNDAIGEPNRMPMLGKQKKTVVMLEKFEECQKPHPNLVNLTAELLEPNVYWMTGSVKVIEQINQPISMLCNIYSCNGGYENKNCQFNRNIKLDGVCDVLMTKNMPWSPFMDNSTLPRSCPIKKGVYYLLGSKFDFKTLNFLPNFYGQWKINANILTRNVLSLCVNTLVNVERT